MIKFLDKGFESKIRDFLKKKKGKLTEEDILNIRGIFISSEDVSGFSIPWQSSGHGMIYPDMFFNINDSANDEWIKDLALFTHIKCLHLMVPTQKLTFLKEFNQLKELYVLSSAEKDWSFMENLISLNYLFLDKCNFNDLSPIAELSKKQYEEFEKHENDEDMLNFYDGLECLGLTACNIKDITPLAQCPNVAELNLSDNSIEDITAVGSIKKLYYLTLRHNNINNIDALKYCTELYFLNLRHNLVEDIKVLKELVHLGRLFLGFNKIKDFTAVKALNLVYTDIE